MADSAYIDGRWHAGRDPGSAGRLESTSPVTGALNWEGVAASPDQVADAVMAARRAFPGWSLRPVGERVAAMERWAAFMVDNTERIARAISAEIGKPLWEARGEAGAMAGKVAISIRAQRERAGTRSPADGQLLSHHAHGVMAVFGPFNFPGHLPNGHIVPALLAGNTVVLKPSELTPSVGAIFADAAEAAGLPQGVLGIVQGGRDTGAALLESDINGVLFTGSAATGTHFHNLFGGRPEVILALEMGGNNPLIIHDATDVQAAADLAVVSAFISAGQRCSCARRLILPKGAFGDAVADAIAARIPQLPIGAPEEDVFMGTVVHAGQAAHALEFEKGLVSKGGRSLVALDRFDPDGAFLRPGLIDVTEAQGVADEELFAPLLQLVRVDGLDDMIAQANATRFGLAGGVVTEDEGLWAFARPRMRAGIVNWNRPTTGAASSMPFGGPGLSGNSRPGAYYAADYCAWPKASQMDEVPNAPTFPGYPD